MKKETPLEISLNKRIIFALDVDSAAKARDWVHCLEERVKFYKVGLELFLAGGMEIVDWIVSRGLEVMLDLKFFDVPQTVASAVRQVQGKNISYVTVHGNDSIMKSAADAARDTKILAVTVLTSLDQGDLNDLGFQCRVEDLVLSRARRALELGCSGVVSSGLELARLRQNLGDRLCIVVPGVRPVVNRPGDDQKRTIDIKNAFEAGASHVVVGRPIRNSSDPLQTVKEMQEVVSRLHPY